MVFLSVCGANQYVCVNRDVLKSDCAGVTIPELDLVRHSLST